MRISSTKRSIGRGVLACATAALLVSPVTASSDVYDIVVPDLDALTFGLWSALTKPKEDKRYTDDYCKTDGAYCGVIAYANGGAYTVKSVDVHAKSSQETTPLNPYCEAVDKKFTSNLTVNQYDTFIVPANCTYKLKINIQSGPKKDRDIILTPGCLAQTWTNGNIASSSWKKDISWVDGAKPSGASSTPTDGYGNTCKVS